MAAAKKPAPRAEKKTPAKAAPANARRRAAPRSDDPATAKTATPATKRGAKSPAAAKSAPKKPAARRRSRAKPTGLRAQGAHVVSVFGAFNSRALVEMPVGLAEELFDEALPGCGPHNVIDAILRELEDAAARSSDGAPALGIADGALAAMAVALGRELEHPYNSATAKSMCAGRLQEVLAELRKLAPPERKADKIDELDAYRKSRRAAAAGSAAPADLPRT